MPQTSTLAEGGLARFYRPVAGAATLEDVPSLWVGITPPQGSAIWVLLPGFKHRHCHSAAY